MVSTEASPQTQYLALIPTKHQGWGAPSSPAPTSAVVGFPILLIDLPSFQLAGLIFGFILSKMR